jgi:phospholipid/cholesterol/gamma-HCH transport system substrate-binding protein
LLGAVVLAGLAGAVVAVGLINGWPGTTFHVRAGFPRVHGVEVGTRVRVQGIDAGQVEAIKVPAEPGGDVVLVLRLKNEMRNLVRANATAQIVSEGMVGGKVVEIYPGTAAEPVGEDALLASVPSTELTDVLAQVGNTLQDVKDGQGTVQKLLKDPEAYVAMVSAIKQIDRTAASAQQDLEAMKKLPLVGGYVEDVNDILVRPKCEVNRWVFAEADLFEPGRAVLTAQGRKALDDQAPKMTGFRQKGVEVVVVGYANPNSPNPTLAQKLTQQQSEAVLTYLKDRHRIHDPGWIASGRKVTALGMGVKPPPQPAKDNPPGDRIEVLVFVPQG